MLKVYTVYGQVYCNNNRVNIGTKYGIGLTSVVNWLHVHLQVLLTNITWKQCAGLPIKTRVGKTTFIYGKVYYGGVRATEEDEYNVYCYDPSQDNWTTLPPLPVRWFGLGQLNGKLVAVGGWKKSDDRATNEIYGVHSKKWKQTIPPMPTARHSSCVLSLQSALVVAGGSGYSDAVEIFNVDTSQWYRTDPLPTACLDISLTVIGSTCYALGGYRGSGLNQALYASIDDLFHNAVPANQTTHSGSSDTQSAWKTLASTPTYRPAAAVLAGNLLAIGGNETPEGGADMKEVYMYSPSINCWVYISDLPTPQTGIAAAVLSSTEILVMGGGYVDRVNSVYMGTL